MTTTMKIEADVPFHVFNTHVEAEDAAQARRTLADARTWKAA